MTLPPKRRDTLLRLERAAMRWYKWLTIGRAGADYHTYCRAFVSLERACAAHAAAKGKRGRKHGM